MMQNAVYIFGQPVYCPLPGLIEFKLPFTPYRFSLPGHNITGETNVNNAILAIYDERTAVGITVWGDLKERFPADLRKLNVIQYANMRAQVIRNITFERLWPESSKGITATL